jgi:hypothetical protein
MSLVPVRLERARPEPERRQAEMREKFGLDFTVADYDQDCARDAGGARLRFAPVLVAAPRLKLPSASGRVAKVFWMCGRGGRAT